MSISTGNKCPICDKQLYSIITRRIGETAVCIDCGDELTPLVDAILNDIVIKCQIVAAYGHGIKVSQYIPTLLNDYTFIEGDQIKEKILRINEASRR